MMTLNDAVDLVIYAFTHGENGDLFVQKAPASTIQTLAESIIDLYHANSNIITIGTRHGEKLYETLVTREEMSKSIDMDNYFRIPCDSRDLNYDKFFIEGEEEIAKKEDYHSHNTEQLDIDAMKSLLLKLEIIKPNLNV